MTVTVPKTVAVVDACVLYPPSLRDLLMWLASYRIHAPRWTEQIHTEWIRNVLANSPEVTPAQLDRTRRLMNQVATDCVVTGYEALIPTLRLPDENDRHVLAAAIKAEAPFIVTFNLSDLPNTPLRAHGTQAVHPDDFLSGLFDERTNSFLQTMRTHRASLYNPPKDAPGYVQTLRVVGLKKLAARAEANLSNI